tara:strand:- start:53 stop:1090 length:1038 start_codon:yes stop_codon:yes gene_type:complete
MVTPKYKPYFGGASHVFGLIAENLVAKYGDEVRVLTSSAKEYSGMHKGVKIRRLFPYFTKKWQKILFAPIGFLMVFFYFLKNSRKFDVVESHTVGEICLFSQIMAKLFRKKLVKHVIDMHTSKRLLKWPKADRYINCGTVITDKMIKAGIPRTRIHEINLPIVSNSNKNYNKNKKGAKIFMFVGEVSKKKGVKDLLSAMYYLPKTGESADIELHIAGTGPMSKKIEKAAKHDERIVCHGHMHHNNVINMMKHTDVLVHPTYDDVMPLTVLEAMMMGNAIITRDVGEIKKNVNGAGIFVHNREELLQAMKDVIEKDPVDKKKKALKQFAEYSEQDVYGLNRKAVLF